MEKIEKRAYPVKVEVRSADGGKPEIVMSIPYNSWSEDLGGFREKISPGAFDDSLDTDDIRSFWNHNSDFILGRTKNGTLRFEKRSGSVVAIATPPDTQWARDAITSTEGGYVDGASFAFVVIDQRWDETKKIPERTIDKATIFEFSPVAMPAYPRSKAASRALESAGINPALLERFIEARSAGLDIDPDAADAARSTRDALDKMLEDKPDQIAGDDEALANAAALQHQAECELENTEVCE